MSNAQTLLWAVAVAVEESPHPAVVDRVSRLLTVCFVAA
jgi:hypothetical protein